MELRFSKHADYNLRNLLWYVADEDETVDLDRIVEVHLRYGEIEQQLSTMQQAIGNLANALADAGVLSVEKIFDAFGIDGESFKTRPRSATKDRGEIQE